MTKSVQSTPTANHGTSCCRRSMRGFTLIEMAVVLFIFGLLIAGLLGPLETQLEARDRAQTIETMDEILETLYGFAITNGRLPCPDTDGDGIANPVYNAADPTSVNCLNDGFVPWVNLNVDPGDAWGNRFRYRITAPNFGWQESDGICGGPTQDYDLCATGNITVNTRGDNPATTPAVEGKALLAAAATLPAVLISHGKNGLGATSINGAARAAPPPATDEWENADGDGVFINRVYTADNNACSDDADESTALCVFDDIVKWVSPALLNNRMVVAGRLP